GGTGPRGGRPAFPSVRRAERGAGTRRGRARAGAGTGSRRAPRGGAAGGPVRGGGGVSGGEASRAGAWHATRSAVPLAVRGPTAIAVLVSVAVAVFARWAITDQDVAAQVALGVVAAAVFSLWVGWMPRLLLLWVDGVEARVPGLAAMVLRTLAIAALATVLLP